MTYTFKLARRLAVSRSFLVIPALALLAACMGDATAPEADPTGSLSDNPISLNVTPRSVTIETNQRVRFISQSRNFRGDLISMPVAWGATGGTISTDGVFSSAASGSFKVVGRGKGWKDTSVVIVVPPASDLVRLAVTPDSVTLSAGAKKTFSVTGYQSDGTSVTVGVTWSATGGTVDPSGVYTADSTGGAYHVIATNTAGTLADTAIVRITPPPAPTLTSLILSPITVSLTSGTTRQFKAYGRNSAGDSVAVSVAFNATGGTITSGGLYTAGQTAGNFRVIASASGLADTAPVTLSSASTSALEVGIPFGPFGLWDGTTLRPNAALFSFSQQSIGPTLIVDRIAAARAAKVKLMLAMTGGHAPYLSTIDGVLQFDRAKWNARMQEFNTPEIRDAIAKGVADGTIVGNVVMDEPNVSGGGDGNTWGPVGTMTKARVDSLCGYVKQIFPTLPAGVQHRWDVFEPTKSYRVCDFLSSQYTERAGSVTTFRDGGLALAARDHHAILFSLNILNGGTQDRDGTWDCTGTGGLGTYSPNCRMTASQVRDYGLVLGPAGCAMAMWQYDLGFMSDAGNQQAFKDIGARLATLPRKPCTRT